MAPARIRPRAYAAQAGVPSKTKASKNTKGIKWPKLDSAIVLWDDFCLSTLNEDEDESYGHMLDLEVPAAQLAAGSRSPSPMTSCISTRRRRSFNNAVPHAYIYKDQVLVRVAHRVSLDEFPLQNLVVGLGRPSSKLQCRQVASNPGAMSKKGIWPLQQLANLCDTAKIRYGYIITKKDLLACCFFKTTAATISAAKATAL
ncbi:hypothetical protein F4801DRAFT_577211 [Xylaria longipes]|nr:hypothetical protein F4801DRAFT_577211 [Xylaria longipes]